MYCKKNLFFRYSVSFWNPSWHQSPPKTCTDALTSALNLSAEVIGRDIPVPTTFVSSSGDRTASSSVYLTDASGASSASNTPHASSHSPLLESRHTPLRFRATLQSWNLAMLRERYGVLYSTTSKSKSFSSSQWDSKAEEKFPDGKPMDRQNAENAGVYERSIPFGNDDAYFQSSKEGDAKLQDHLSKENHVAQKIPSVKGASEAMNNRATGSTFSQMSGSPPTSSFDFITSLHFYSQRESGSSARHVEQEAGSVFCTKDSNGAVAPATTSAKVRSSDQFDSMPFSDRWELVTRSLYPLGNVSVGNKVVVFRNSGDANLTMWEAIDNAEKEVLLQTYIFKDDFVGRKTVQKLVDAQKRKCTTELLYDDGGNISGRGRLMEPLRNAGASVIVYRPILSHLWRYMLTFNWRISPGGLRNHRKILLVDKKIGFCGGLNVGNEYCGTNAGGTGRFRDTHCSVVGPALVHLRKVYEDTKKPEPSRFSWSRWRQRATTGLRRTYRSGSSALVNRVVRPVQKRTASARQRSRYYFKPSSFPRALKTYSSSTSPFGRGVPAREASDAAAATHLVTESVSTISPSHTSSSRTTPPLKRREKVYQVFHSSLTKPSTFHYNQSQRLRHFALSLVSRNRRTTKALLGKPIADTEPVPEAGPYSQRVPVTTQILQSNPHNGNFSIQYAFWQVVRKCHRRVWITTPYFLPSGKHWKALVHAARRGVDVRLLTGSRRTTDPWVMWYASTYITERLLRNGVKVFEYNGAGVMHAKTVVADSLWSSIGSFNWDPMSNKNLEVSLCHLDHATARVMEMHFLEDQAVSVEVTLEAHLRRPYWKRFVSWLFYHCVFLVDRLTFKGFEIPDLKYVHDSELPPQ